MNLSSYLQMPPAPNVPQSPTTSATHGLAAGIRADAGKSAGQDFASIMALQFQRLSAPERPSFAVDTPTKPDFNTQANPSQRAQWANGQSFATQQRLKDERQHVTPRDAHQEQALAQSQDRQVRQARADSADNKDVSQSDADKSHAEKLAEQRAQQLRDAASAKALNEADATLLAQVAMMAMPSAMPTQGSAPSPTEASLNLRAVALSPQMHIITTPNGTPNAESLTAFAQSMGLDEAAIQKLLGEGAPSPSAMAGTTSPAGNTALVAPNAASATSNPALASLNALPELAHVADTVMQALNSAVITSSPLTSTPPTSSAFTQLAALGLLPDAATTAVTGNALPTNITADTPATAQATALALNTSAAPVAGPLASLQNMVTPASGNGASPKTAPGTLDTVTLLSGDITEESVSDLMAQFSNHTAGGDDAQQQPSSSHSGSQGFAQTLAQTTAPAQVSGANSASPVATTTPMGEVYDQLSDKMATEMAARMHKQLNDGEWKMKFGLRPAHLGGVEIQLEMKDGKLNAMFQAENPLTRELLQNSSQRLRDALENFGIQAGQMHIGQESGHAQQNPSRGSAKPTQVGDNSPMQVKDSDNVASATENRTKANASLLDLYA
jgi:flagellar hook-length control protein FliK